MTLTVKNAQEIIGKVVTCLDEISKKGYEVGSKSKIYVQYDVETQKISDVVSEVGFYGDGWLYDNENYICVYTCEASYDTVNPISICDSASEYADAIGISEDDLKSVVAETMTDEDAEVFPDEVTEKDVVIYIEDHYSEYEDKLQAYFEAWIDSVDMNYEEKSRDIIYDFEVSYEIIDGKVCSISPAEQIVYKL